MSDDGQFSDYEEEIAVKVKSVRVSVLCTTHYLVLNNHCFAAF